MLQCAYFNIPPFLQLLERDMGIEERTKSRRKRMVANRAASFREAEAWDLEFWQNQTPEARLSALVAIREDVKRVGTSRKRARGRGKRAH
jgi:hypothetical protein